MAHEKDMTSKKLEDYTDVFADILNVLLFHKNLLKPELLKSGPTESIYKTDVQTLNDQRRDTLKDYMDESRFLIASIGIENQSTIQKIMPIRIMGYDYGSYRQQLSDNVSFLRPVITIVLNFSMKRWTSGKSLHEILKIPKELKPYVQDYKIYVFDIAFLDDDVINTFTSDFKAVARFFRQKRLNSKEMLEEELQVPLFLRGKKRITLTEAGKTLYEQAGNLLMLSDLAKREVIKSSQSATLHIGMTPSTVSMMSDHLLHFAKKYPKVRFDVHEGSTFTLKDQLENRIIDLTTLRTPIALNGCETKPLLKESLMAMSIPDSPLLQERSSIPLKELSRQPLILSYRYRKYMLAAFERAGLMCDIYFTCGDARTAMTMAEKGLGIAILPASMQTLSSKLTSCRISGADLTTEILLAWRKEQLPEEIQDFLKMWD